MTITENRISEERIKEVQKNLFKHFRRISEKQILDFWNELQNKVQKNEYQLTSKERYRMFVFFLLNVLANDKKVNSSIIRYVNKEDKRFICLGDKHLSLKQNEETEAKLLKLFTSQEVKQELKRFLKVDCKVYFDDEDDVEIFLNHISNLENNEMQEFQQLYKDLKLFGMNASKVFS